MKAPLLVLLLLMLSCTEATEPDSAVVGAIPNPSTSNTTEEAVRPDTLIARLKVEGSSQADTMVLYHSPSDWPLNFSTYLPAGVQVHSIITHEGEVLQFKMNEASFNFYVFPAETSRSLAQELATKVLNAEGIQSCEYEEAWEWSCLHAKDKRGTVNRIRLGELNDRLFYFHYLYPLEYSEGFVPRARFILKNWQWQ